MRKPSSDSRTTRSRAGLLTLGLALTLAGFGCSDANPPAEANAKAATPSEPPAATPAASVNSPASPSIPESLTALLDDATVDTTAQAPGLEDRAYVAPLADAYSRIDPTNDGWNTEAFHEQATACLGSLAKQMGDPTTPLAVEVSPEFATSSWVPADPVTSRNSERGFTVERLAPAQAPLKASLAGIKGLQEAAEGLRTLFADAPEVKFKHYRIEPDEDGKRVRSRASLVETP